MLGRNQFLGVDEVVEKNVVVCGRSNVFGSLMHYKQRLSSGGNLYICHTLAPERDLKRAQVLEQWRM